MDTNISVFMNPDTILNCTDLLFPRWPLNTGIKKSVFSYIFQLIFRMLTIFLKNFHYILKKKITFAP